MSKVKSQKLKVESRRLKVRAWVVAAFLLAFNFQLSTLDCFSATKVFLKSAASAIKPPIFTATTGWSFRLASATQGAAMAGNTTTSVAGPLTGHYFPITTLDYICRTATNNYQLLWFTPPLSAGVTISGTITPNIWGLESAAQCNCGFRYEVLRWDVLQGGIVSSLGISTDNGATEWGTTAAVRTSPTLTPTSTNFVTGDRIVIVIYNDDGNGVTEASGRSWSLRIDGPTGVDGDSYLSFTETITFSSDTNNARRIPLTSWNLLPHLLSVWRAYWETILS